MIKKQFYEAPEAELLEIKFEAKFLDGSLTGFGDTGKAGGTLDTNDYGDGDDALF